MRSIRGMRGASAWTSDNLPRVAAGPWRTGAGNRGCPGDYGRVDIVVVDSVAALVPKAELDGEMGTATWDCMPGSCPGAAQAPGVVSRCNTCLIFINQVREKIRRGVRESGDDHGREGA